MAINQPHKPLHIGDYLVHLRRARMEEGLNRVILGLLIRPRNHLSLRSFTNPAFDGFLSIPKRHEVTLYLPRSRPAYLAHVVTNALRRQFHLRHAPHLAVPERFEISPQRHGL